MAACSGISDGHCCYIGGKVCRFLEENTVAGRRWACGLRRKLGAWSQVHRSPEYLSSIKPALDGRGLPDCGDWPRSGERCAECGVVG